MKRFSEILELSDQDLKARIEGNERSSLMLRLQRKSGEVKPHHVRALRREVARIKTALRLKQLREKGGR